MLLRNYLIISVLFIGLSCSSTNLRCDDVVQSDIFESIKGTVFETAGEPCDKVWTNDSLKDASDITKLYLFLRQGDKNISEIIYGNISSFVESGFDTSKTTKVLVHGWMESATDGFATDLRDAFFAAQSEEMNVLSVDWSQGAHELYPLARLYVVPVGKFMAKFLDWLDSEAGVSVDSLHLIGLSLGAHVAGTIGERLTTGRIGRITGLDPAGPGFTSDTSGRLDQSDAQFVDIIHTCGHWAGYYEECGHVDFYPNRGVYNQPGCPLDIGLCSHKRSYQLFNESISSWGFVSRECDSWTDYTDGKCKSNNSTIMGERVNLRARGKFYLLTGGSYPYALGNSVNSKL